MKKADLIEEIVNSNKFLAKAKDNGKGDFIIGYGTPSFEGEKIDEEEAVKRLGRGVTMLLTVAEAFGIDKLAKEFVLANLGKNPVCRWILNAIHGIENNHGDKVQHLNSLTTRVSEDFANSVQAKMATLESTDLWRPNDRK